MNGFKSIGSMLIAGLLLGCFGGPPEPGVRNPPPRLVDRDQEDYSRRRRDRADQRDRVFRRSYDRYGGRTCEDELEDDRNHDCRDMCRDIYSRDRDGREECEELSVAQIERLEEIHEELENPSERSLAGIDAEDFEVYLETSIAGLDDLVGDYRSSEAEDFLLWIIEDDEIAELFTDHDRDFEIFETLLDEFSSGTVDQKLTKRLDRDLLMEEVISRGSEDTLVWVEDYVKEKGCDEDESDTHSECFELFCKIGDAIDEDARDDWLSTENFQEYIDDIINEETNGANWKPTAQRPGGSDPYEDSGDIDEDWVDALCATLL